MIKAIIFDFFGVLCSDEYWRFVKEDKNTGAHFYQLANDVNRGSISWHDFLERVSKDTGQTFEKVQQLYANEQINLELVAYIDQLHKSYKTALLTNASDEFINPLLQRAGLTKLFDVVTVSSTIGVVKPEPSIFEHTVKELGVQTHEAVFIDDQQRHIEGAKRVGLRAIKYENFEQLKTELQALLTNSDN